MSTPLPLLPTGEMDCDTCHEPSSWPPHGSGDEQPSHLRIGNLKRELCLNCHAGDGLPKAVVHVAVPPSKALVHERRVTLVGSAEHVAGERLEVRVNGATFPLQVRSGVFFTRLSLQPGLNVAEVSLRGKRLWRGEVFFADGSEPGVQYGREYLPHLTGAIDECFGCHDSREGLLDPTAPASPELCYRCHDTYDNGRYLHGPLAVGDCLTCHDPHGGTDGAHLRERAGVLCRSCHGEPEIAGHDEGVREVERGLCTACHDPHQADRRYLIRSASR